MTLIPKLQAPELKPAEELKQIGHGWAGGQWGNAEERSAVTRVTVLHQELTHSPVTERDNLDFS